MIRRLLLLALPIMLGSGPVADCALLPQEVARQMRLDTVVRLLWRADSDSVGFVTEGEILPVSECTSGWCRVSTEEFAGYVPDSMFVAAEILSPPPRGVRPAPRPRPAARRCCRVCTTGKACGNSCINRSYTCRQPPGCACNG